MSSEPKKTSKIRKQPRRASRKELRPYFKNPLELQGIYLPHEIRGNIDGLQYLCIRNMQDLIPGPLKATNQVLQEMRKAVLEQERKVNEYRGHRHSPNSTTDPRESEHDMHQQWSERHSEDYLHSVLHPHEFPHTIEPVMDIQVFLRNED